MSSDRGFSNTSTGDKPADPFTVANKDTNASLQEKVEDLSKFMRVSKYAMMTTRDSSTGRLVSRVMALAAQENGGVDLVFHTNTETKKTDELSGDPHVNISFLNSSGEWASVSAIAEIVTDRATIVKYYSPALRAWIGDLGDGIHDGGENDPRIGIIRAKMATAVYSVGNSNALSQAIQVTESTVTGKPPQVNKLREISEDEVESWRANH